MISVTYDEIEAGAFIEAAKSRETGAIVTFVGVVRDDGIESMELEAYEEVANADLREIAEKVTEKYSLNHVDIIHRIGHLRVGGPSLL